MAVDIGPRIGVDGEKAFRDAMNRVCDAIKLTNAQMKAAMAQFDRADKSEEKLTQQNALLEKSIEGWRDKLKLLNANLETQKAKLTELGAALDRAKKSGGDNAQEVAKAEAAYTRQAREVNKCEVEVARATESLNRMDRQLRSNKDELNRAADSADDLGDELEDAGDKSLKFGDVLKANVLGSAISKGLGLLAQGIKNAGSALANAAKDGVELASDLAESQNVVDTTFGESAGVINEWAKAAATSYGISELAAKQYNGTLGAMLKSMGLSQDAVVEMSTAMVGLAGDMASFYNLDVGTAFEKIRSGISGETEPLKQLGINMSVANLQAYALSQGITKAYSSMSQAEQATLRYNYLMSVTADAQGDFADTSDSLANQQRILALQIENAKGAIGQALYPVITQITTAFNEWFATVDKEKLTETIKSVVQTIVGNGPLIISIISGIAAGMAAFGIASLITKVVSAFKVLFTTLQAGTGIMKALGAAMNTNPIFLIVSAVAALVTAFITLWNTSEDFRNFWIGLWDTISGAFSAAWDGIVNFFTKTIPDAFNGFINWIKKNWQGLLLLLVNPIAGAFKLIYDNCEGFRNFVNNFVQTIKNFFVNGWNAIVAFFTETIPAWIASVVEWFNELPRKIGEMIGILIGHVIQFGVNLWNWVTVELPQIIQAVVDWFAQLPGRIWEWLKFAALKVVQWGVDVYTTMKTKAEEAITAVVDWFAALPGKIWDWLVATVQKVIQWGVNLRDKAKQAATDMVTNVVDTIKSLPGKIMDIGKNIVTGLWEGIQSMVGWIKDKISGFLGGIVDGVKGVLGIHSPSKVFAGIGEYMGEGLGIGFADSMRTVAGQMQNAIPTTLTGPSLANVAGTAAGNTGATVAASPVSVVLRIDNFNNYSQDDLAAISDMVAAQIQDKVTRQQGVFR